MYDDDEDPLEAVALDEGSGKIAVCTHRTVRIYKPFGLEEDALKVLHSSLFHGSLSGEIDPLTVVPPVVISNQATSPSAC